MAAGGELPGDIDEAVSVIRALGEKNYLSRAERETLNRAKLRIAFWACRNENIVATRENLTYILGPDAASIMSAYDKYLQREDEAEKSPSPSKRRSRGSEFWEGS